jgi:hypothetical protein
MGKIGAWVFEGGCGSSSNVAGGPLRVNLRRDSLFGVGAPRRRGGDYGWRESYHDRQAFHSFCVRLGSLLIITIFFVIRYVLLNCPKNPLFGRAYSVIFKYKKLSVQQSAEFGRKMWFFLTFALLLLFLFLLFFFFMSWGVINQNTAVFAIFVQLHHASPAVGRKNIESFITGCWPAEMQAS